MAETKDQNEVRQRMKPGKDAPRSAHLQWERNSLQADLHNLTSPESTRAVKSLIASLDAQIIQEKQKEADDAAEAERGDPESDKRARRTNSRSYRF